jgi:hypothetical protein
MKVDNFRKEIRNAADYMAVGEKQKSRDILIKLLNAFPKKKSLYADAVNIYLTGNMFDEAKEVFETYKGRFDEDLQSDFSLADIVKQKNEFLKAAKTYEGAPVKTFRRMSAFERGRLTNLPTLNPIKEIKLSKDEISLKKGTCQYRYHWADVQDAFITSRAGYKGTPFSEAVIRTLNLKTPDGIFKIDVSSYYPDFKNNELLLNELRKYIALRDDKRD